VTVTVLLFASYAEALGADTIRCEIPANATVADVVSVLRARAGGDRIPLAPLVAINQRYAVMGDRINASDEIALIPPVAGG
jgi:molybdopterin converting factor small subunit